MCVCVYVCTYIFKNGTDVERNEEEKLGNCPRREKKREREIEME
jgi:hypothetical protein